MSANKNRFIFRVGTLGVVAIALVAFVPPFVKNSTHASRDIFNLETKCWNPAHFSLSQVEFANAVCADEVRRNKTQPLPPPHHDDIAYVERIGENGATIDDIITSKPNGECFTFVFLAAELVLLFVFYLVMPKKDDERDLKVLAKEGLEQGYEVTRSRSKMNVVVYLMMTACFSFLAVAPHMAVPRNGKPTYHSGEALCTFQIRHLGSITRYTLQCFYSYEEPSGVNMQRALMFNSALCGIIAIMSLLAIRPFRR